MSAHGPMPRSAWMFPALAVLFFAGATALGVTFTPSAKPLVLGVDAQSMVLLVLTFVLSVLTFGTGRTNILFGLVHVVVFAVFVFLVFVP